MLGQVFAAPVLPFIREVKRFPDEPGARHLTCQLFAQAGNDSAPLGGALLILAGGLGPAQLLRLWLGPRAFARELIFALEVSVEPIPVRQIVEFFVQ